MGPAKPASHVEYHAREADQMAAFAEEFPDLDLHQVFGGYEAVPKGTPVVRGMTIDSLMGKLREQGS